MSAVARTTTSAKQSKSFFSWFIVSVIQRVLGRKREPGKTPWRVNTQTKAKSERHPFGACGRLIGGRTARIRARRESAGSHQSKRDYLGPPRDCRQCFA